MSCKEGSTFSMHSTQRLLLRAAAFPGKCSKYLLIRGCLFWGGVGKELGFELRASHLQSKLELHLQYILLWLFWRWGLKLFAQAGL
jgi:hypothetical protein